MSEEKMMPCPACGSENLCSPKQNSAQKELGFYYVWCCDCGTGGPECETPKDAIHSWNALPRALRWMKEPPTKPGWYWARFSDKTGKPRLLEIQEYNLKAAQRSTKWEWAGPIPQPREK